MKRRRHITENVTTSSPYGNFLRKNYQIAPVRGVVLDYHGHDYDAWLHRRELEQEAISPNC